MQRQDHFIHELSSEALQSIIRYGAWSTGAQSITSAITNQDNISEPDEHYLTIGENTSGPTAFVDIQFDSSVKRVLDVGGGRFDVNKHYLKKAANIDLSIWDPFNRSQKHNDLVRSAFEKEKADAATSMSVLNVIPECEARLAHIVTLFSAIKLGATIFVKIWPGEAPYKGSYLPTATNDVYQANAFADRFIHEIEAVFGIGNVHLSTRVNNLIIAVKQSDALPSKHEIKTVLARSENKMPDLLARQTKALRKMRRESSILILFQRNLGLFKSDLENNRHANDFAQREYDRRFGLTLYQK